MLPRSFLKAPLKITEIITPTNSNKLNFPSTEKFIFFSSWPWNQFPGYSNINL